MDKKSFKLQMLAELKKSFIETLPERIAGFESQILALEKNQDFTRQYEELYRGIHSLKGSGGTHGIPVLTSICHQFEDFLNLSIIDDKIVNPNGIKGCLEYIDLLHHAVELLQKDADVSPLNSEISELYQRHFPKQLNALLVEPSKLYSQICQQILMDKNIRVTECSNGFQALERLLTQHFDVLVTSMETPMLNGLALIQAIRYANNENSQLNTILLTSKSDLTKADAQIDYVIGKDTQLATRLDEALDNVITQ